jgi:hypothetical protein
LTVAIILLFIGLCVQPSFANTSLKYDNSGEDSSWTYLKVNIPKDKQSIDHLFLRFLEKHPQLFSILKKIVRAIIKYFILLFR